MTKLEHVLILIAATGCGANVSGNTSAACSALSGADPTPPTWGGSVFTLVMENKNASDIFGNSAAPYINQLAKQYTIAQGYHDSYVHPSEPNYLWMVAGQNFGILDDDDPASHSIDATSHIADQLELAGMTWKAYEEGMGAPCGLVSHDRYAAKHDPFVFFDDINGWDGKTFQPSARCNEHVVDYSQFDVDLAANALPRYVFITPNLDDDMHDGSIQQGDQWASQEIPKILASPAFTNGGVLFLLWDEGSGTIAAGDDPPFIAISPNAKPGYVSTVDYDTSSYLESVQTILGLQTLPCGDPQRDAGVQAMTDLFTVPMAKQ